MDLDFKPILIRSSFEIKKCLLCKLELFEIKSLENELSKVVSKVWLSVDSAVSNVGLSVDSKIKIT